MRGNWREAGASIADAAFAEADPSEAELRKVDILAQLLDSRFKLFGVRFGYDTLIGLVPGIGDLVTTGLSGYVLYQAIRHRVPTGTFLSMTGNVLFDAALGVVPIVGDIADIGFRANLKNARLLREHVESRRAESRYGPAH